MDFCTCLHFSWALLPAPHPAGRSDPAFLCEVLGEVIKAGATTVNITDTIGWCLPHEFLVSLVLRCAGLLSAMLCCALPWSTPCAAAGRLHG